MVFNGRQIIAKPGDRSKVQYLEIVDPALVFIGGQAFAKFRQCLIKYCHFLLKNTNKCSIPIKKEKLRGFKKDTLVQLHSGMVLLLLQVEFFVPVLRWQHIIFKLE